MHVNTILFKIIFNISILSSILLILYFTFIVTDRMKESYHHNHYNLSEKVAIVPTSTYNVWLILTKVVDKSQLMQKFKQLILNVLNVTSVPLSFHIIVDDNSKNLVDDFMNETSYRLNTNVKYDFYPIEKAAARIKDIVSVMTPHFSSKPGTYYSDALFYISLGLHRIAPSDQDRAIMIDCDLYMKDDLLLLFKEFEKFEPGTLFGLVPELTPVYRHVLHKYRTQHRNSSFGDYRRPTRTFNDTRPYGYQGYNSGVILIDLAAARRSRTYEDLLKSEHVERLTEKYRFKGHLGDQDFYTLLGYERPELIRELDCGFNRQLCLWWRDHGYKDVFDRYHRCDGPIVILHGNCNSKIPALK